MYHNSFPWPSMNSVFMEITSSKEQPEENPELIHVVISQVEPKYCSELLKELAQVLPLVETMKPGSSSTTFHGTNDETSSRRKSRVNLSHLRRVRRRYPYDEASTQVPPEKESAYSIPTSAATTKKRRMDEKEPYIIEVLLGEVAHVNDLPSATLEHLVSNYNLVLEQLTVLGRRPTTDNFSADTSWPFVSQPTKDTSSNANNVSVSSLLEEEHEEMQRMMDGMKEVIRDAYNLNQKYQGEFHQRCSTSTITNAHTNHISTNSEKDTCSDIAGGAIIMCSKTNRILSMASTELAEQLQLLSQQENGSTMLKTNPLITPVILAIQGISRRERQTAYNEGSLTSETFRNGQYLCTGLTMFLTREPNIYEAMALVHSRISRVIYGVPRRNSGGFGGGILDPITSKYNSDNTGGEPPVYIHNLPGINHHYRVFCCNPNSDLYRECKKLHPM